MTTGGDIVDPFDKWFEKFSTEHSWYKNGAESGYFFIPQNDPEYPWTLHSWYVWSDLPLEVRSLIESNRTPINGLIYGRHGHGHGLHIALGDVGWPFLDYLRDKGYDEASRLLKRNCKDNSATRNSRYKIHIDMRDIETTKGVIWDMFCSEYDRMRTLARENYYRLLSRLYPWLRSTVAKTRPLGHLTYVARQYHHHLRTIKSAANELALFPNEITDLFIEYHHIF